MWNGGVARELTDDVLELEGADHGLATLGDLQQIVAPSRRARALDIGSRRRPLATKSAAHEQEREHGADAATTAPT